ncbi:MAG: hypothetical protein ABW168_04515 [Sedimenticola sp.]
MKTKKLLTAVKDYFDESKEKQLKKKKYLKQVLEELKTRQKSLRKKLNEEKDAGEKTTIQKKLDMISYQRNKGLKLLKALRTPPAKESEAEAGRPR